jgi:hypothetical protein
MILYAVTNGAGGSGRECVVTNRKYSHITFCKTILERHSLQLCQTKVTVTADSYVAEARSTFSRLD